VNDRVEHAFALTIRWVGAQDKPYYGATFVSETRRGTVADAPFQGVAVIASEELARMLAVLREHGVTLAPGREDRDDANEYVIELSTTEDDLSGSLGDERRSLPILSALRDALDAEHRKPLDDVLDRLGGWANA
jgi:hypothetical protein